MTSSNNSVSESERSSHEVAFFGRITASVTHELNNVLSIVEQSAGLLDDMIAGEDRGVPISVERLKGVSSSVQKQTRRGLEIVARLNRFAHTTDRIHTSFDANEVVSNLADLCRRFALLKKLDLEFRPAPVAPRLEGNPFVLQQSVFLTLQEALDKSAGGSAIVIENKVDSTGVGVNVEWSGSVEIDPSRLAAIRALAGQMNGTAEMEAGSDRIRISLRFAHPQQGSES